MGPDGADTASCALGTGTPVRGGLTFREAHYICEAIAETGCLVGLDIMVSFALLCTYPCTEANALNDSSN